MTADEKQPDPGMVASGRARRLKTIGCFILLLGGVCAAVVYWQGQRAAAMDDPAMLGFNRAERRQMDVMYGKMGSSINDLGDELKQPNTQAVLIVVGAVILAGGCFFFARLPAGDDKMKDEIGWPQN
jgi:hypothetical protein